MNTKTQPTSATNNFSHAEEPFVIGDTVRAHEGALDTRVGISLEGWRGTILSLYDNEQGEEYATVQWSPATLNTLSASVLYDYATHNLSPEIADVLLADLRLASEEEYHAISVKPITKHNTAHQNISLRLKYLQSEHQKLLRARRILAVIIGVLGLLVAITLGVRLANVENTSLLQLCDSLCAWNVVSAPLGENIFKIPVKPEFLANLPEATFFAFLLTALASLKLLWRSSVVPMLLLAGFSLVQINLAGGGWIAPVLCIIIPFTLYELYVFRPKDFRGSTQFALSIALMLLLGSFSTPVAVSAKGSTCAQTAAKNGGEQSTQKQEKFWVAGVCNGCKKEIETAAKGIKGVSKAEWDLKTKIVTIDYNAAYTNPDALKKALVAAGRKVKSPKL
jgi:Cu(I)/Ag(I) efflux system membrane fusion protein